MHSPRSTKPTNAANRPMWSSIRFPSASGQGGGSSSTCVLFPLPNARALAAKAGATLYAPLLTACHQELAQLTGQAGLIVGLAVSGRDRPLPDVHRIFGPLTPA